MRKLTGAAALLCMMGSAASATTPDEIMHRVRTPHDGIIVISHRGCHAPAPHHGLGSAPENSFLALDHCVIVGADVMETDIRQTRDGHLVIMHDDTVDRTTNGTGAVAALSLVQIKALKLRENMGGPAAKLTDQTVPTLDEILARAEGKIVLNLDIKAAIYVEVIDAVHRAHAENRVIVKADAGVGSRPLAPMKPYDSVPFMPMLQTVDHDGLDLPEVITTQSSGAVKPIGFEIPIIASTKAIPTMAREADKAGARLWVNTLSDMGVRELGGDARAVEAPDMVWGKLYRLGVSMFQTDATEALVRFRDTMTK